jgi:hypothetical protein
MSELLQSNFHVVGEFEGKSGMKTKPPALPLMRRQAHKFSAITPTGDIEF